MLQEQLIAVFVAVVAEPIIRLIKNQFNLSGAVMLLLTVVIAALGSIGIVIYGAGLDGLTLDGVIALAPTIFAVGQLIFASIKIAKA